MSAYSSRHSLNSSDNRWRDFRERLMLHMDLFGWSWPVREPSQGIRDFLRQCDFSCLVSCVMFCWIQGLLVCDVEASQIVDCFGRSSAILWDEQTEIHAWEYCTYLWLLRLRVVFCSFGFQFRRLCNVYYRFVAVFYVTLLTLNNYCDICMLVCNIRFYSVHAIDSGSGIGVLVFECKHGFTCILICLRQSCTCILWSLQWMCFLLHVVSCTK